MKLINIKLTLDKFTSHSIKRNERQFRKLTYIKNFFCFTGLFVRFFIFVFCSQCAAAVQILHELKESQLVKEDL